MVDKAARGGRCRTICRRGGRAGGGGPGGTWPGRAGRASGGGRRGAAGCRPGRQGPGAAAPAAIVDSQSAKSSEGGQGRSFDAHGRVTGCTRHALVDVEGNLLLVGVTGAGTADTAAAPELLTQPRRTCPNLRVVWCDPGYQAGFVEAAGGLGLEAAVVGRQPGTGGVAVLPRRWVVEVLRLA
ncbi:MAG TPA: transposase [Frankiaceae bacterium]|nr:transposase [Frankiaceae bacterium]